MISTFFSGIFMATFAASGLFFLKFWRSSVDQLFLRFAIACFLIAFERVVLLLYTFWVGPMTTTQPDATAWVYSIRLVAFALILWAIVAKNRATKQRPNH